MSFPNEFAVLKPKFYLQVWFSGKLSVKIGTEMTGLMFWVLFHIVSPCNWKIVSNWEECKSQKKKVSGGIFWVKWQRCMFMWDVSLHISDGSKSGMSDGCIQHQQKEEKTLHTLYPLCFRGLSKLCMSHWPYTVTYTLLYFPLNLHLLASQMSQFSLSVRVSDLK